MNLGLSKYDIGVITDIVNEYPGLSFIAYSKVLYSIFGKDISPAHFTLLGLKIGEAENRKKSKQSNTNNYLLWQRPN